MFDRFTHSARKVMALANQAAAEFKHDSIEAEHILHGLVREGSGTGAIIILGFGVDLRRVRLEVEKRVTLGAADNTAGRVPVGITARATIESAISEARMLGHEHVGTEHLLLALLRDRNWVSAQVLNALGVTLERARMELRLGTREHREGCPLCEQLHDPNNEREGDVLAKLVETTAVLAENQGSRGWCMLILNDHSEHLGDLPIARQLRIFRDVALVGTTLRRVFATSGKGGGPPRINYECLGNLVPHVHWHVIPRHADDPEPTRPVWGWPEERLKGSITEAERKELIAKLRAALTGM